jgi:iron complex outermembrane receptor protein
MGGIQLPALFNIQTVEVIKGPQGALYGRNSEAGVINVYSLSPDWQPSIATNIQFGVADGADSYAPAKTASVRVSNSLVDNYLAGSLALRYETNQGPFLNLADSDDEAGSLENLQLSSALEMQISPVSELYFRSYLAKNNKGKSQLRFSNGANKTERFVNNYDTDTFDNNTSYIHSLTFNYDMDDVRFVSVTDLTKFSRDF